MKLQRLVSRLSVLKPASQAASVSGSWRDGKSSTQRGYGYKWQKYREQFLFNNPLCSYCEGTGRITAATVVDHIKPHKGNMKLFWNPDNHQSLCASCHSSIKQAEENAASNHIFTDY